MTDPKVGVSREKTAGSGRKRGIPNKLTADVKHMILTALEKGGGVDYFRRQMDENPTAFMTLVGKLLPKDVNASVTASMQMSHSEALQFFRDNGIEPEVDNENGS